MSPAFTLEFEVFCSCGAALCNSSETGTTPRRGTPFLRVEPCGRCLEKEYDRGVQTGKTEGQEEGRG